MRILVVDDEKLLVKGVKFNLENEGYEVECAYDGASAVELARNGRFDLIILDVMMPELDGQEACMRIREFSNVPIIMLTAKSEDADKLMGFECGADDYVTKPFGAAELLARIRSALRNCSHSADSGKLPGGRFSVQDLEILYDARQVFIKGREIKLTQTEYNIVALLSEHCGKMMTYSAIIKGVWGYPDEGSVKKLQVNMANIRKKFGVKPGEATYITNELGVGYRMNSD